MSVTIILLLLIITMVVFIFIIQPQLNNKNKIHRREETDGEKYIYDFIPKNVGDGTDVKPPISVLPSSNSVNSTPSSSANRQPTDNIIGNITNTIVDLAKNPLFWGAVGTQLVLTKILVLVFDKVAREAAKRVFSKITLKFAVSASKILQKIAASGAGQLLAKLGIKTGVAFIEKAAIKASAAVGTKLTASATTSASTGPAAPFVMAGMLIFDVLSLTMDLTDALVPGGTVGYSKMGTKKEYSKMKEEINKIFKDAVKEQGAELPLIVGPLSKLTSEEYAEKINIEVDAILDPNNEPLNPLIEPMMVSIRNDIINGVLTETDIEDNNKMEKYYKFLNYDSIADKALNSVCFKAGGKIVKDGSGNSSCSFNTKTACDNSYKWPLVDENDTYAEWDTEKNQCTLSTSSMRIICESNNIPYNNTTKSCDITENYCLTKGAEWLYNPDINEHDCMINGGQEFAEFLLGTTITRGIKQIFDPNQYKPCKDGEVDTGYFCNGQGCPEGQEYNAGFCYPKCRAGYRGLATVCWPDCPAGFYDHGAGCTKPASYNNGEGRIPDVSCPGDMPNQQGVGMASWCDNGPRLDFWNLRTNPSNKSCNNNEFEYGGFCYSKCSSGFHNVGGNICSPDCPPGMPDGGAFCNKITYDRGVGKAGTYVYPKIRKVPYSTKDN